LVAEGFLRANRDVETELRESELADYLHEARAQRRRFLVRKQEERTAAGRAAAKARGRTGGRPRTDPNNSHRPRFSI
jgi:DNA invertase Pin-like site-specific DNA recombinase